MSLQSPTRCANPMVVGPETKELNLMRANEEYNNGNLNNSIFYQVRSLLNIRDTQYIHDEIPQLNQNNATDEIVAAFNDEEKEDFKKNTLMQSVVQFLKKCERDQIQNSPESPKPNIIQMDFLENVETVEAGYQRIVDVCLQLPREWTVLQICKSFNTATTYSIYKDIVALDGSIYLTLLSHCRSPLYGPACLRVSGKETSDIFKKYATIIERFREVINVDPKEVTSHSSKQKYWKSLNDFGTFLKQCIEELCELFSAWKFLFKGHLYGNKVVDETSKSVLKRVDDFCNLHNWTDNQRVLLSQAALHTSDESPKVVRKTCLEIALHNYVEGNLAYALLETLNMEWQEVFAVTDMKYYPCILVVDERLDHFYWERINISYEFTRFKSFHNLWRLYNFHKSRIKNGYLNVNLKNGTCVINPESNLPNSGRRMRSFFEYWLPNWKSIFERKPTENELIKEAFKQDCYVYAGHGSGLQYIAGKQISKAHINAVVFLFGCDSTRLLTNGLYGGLLGAHNYYHGALCPTVVGTLMPALDSNIDCVAVNMLTRWIAPTSKSVTPWNLINQQAWIQSGKIKVNNADNSGSSPTMAAETKYHSGSLCAIISLIHQGKVDNRIHNNCIYVCRGLPAWNVNVEPLRC